MLMLSSRLFRLLGKTSSRLSREFHHGLFHKRPGFCGSCGRKHDYMFKKKDLRWREQGDVFEQTLRKKPVQKLTALLKREEKNRRKFLIHDTWIVEVKLNHPFFVSPEVELFLRHQAPAVVLKVVQLMNINLLVLAYCSGYLWHELQPERNSWIRGHPEKSGQMGPEETAGRRSFGSGAERGRKARQRRRTGRLAEVAKSFSQNKLLMRLNSMLLWVDLPLMGCLTAEVSTQLEQNSSLSWNEARYDLQGHGSKVQPHRKRTTTRPLWPSDEKNCKICCCSRFCHMEQSQILSASPPL